MRDPAKLRLVAAAEDLAVAAYRATARFPRAEQYGLTSQIRRAAVSVGSNIVEGCHRQGNKAFIAFLHQALGSAAEMQFQLRLSRRLEFADDAELRQLGADTEKMKQGLSRLIVALRSRGD